MFLLDCFCSRVNFWFSNALSSILGCSTQGPQLTNRLKDRASKKAPSPEPNQRQRISMVSAILKSNLRNAGKRTPPAQ